MFGLQPWHIIVIVLVAVLIFGASRLPEIGRSLGKSISEFRKGTKEAAEGFKEEVGKNPNQPQTTAPAQPPVQPLAQMPAQTPAQTGGQPVKPTGNFCIHCGAPNLPEAQFCANCGMKLPEKVA